MDELQSTVKALLVSNGRNSHSKIFDWARGAHVSVVAGSEVELFSAWFLFCCTFWFVCIWLGETFGNYSFENGFHICFPFFFSPYPLSPRKCHSCSDGQVKARARRWLGKCLCTTKRSWVILQKSVCNSSPCGVLSSHSLTETMMHTT